MEHSTASTCLATAYTADNELPVADAHGLAQNAEINFAKYRTVDLAEKVTELISVPEAFREVVKAAFLFTGLSIGACYLIHVYSEITLVPMLGICAYSLVMGVVFGVILGILIVISTSLRNMQSILNIVLEITQNVATDYERIQAGDLRLPSRGELIEQVFSKVVMPVMEGAVASAFGLLRTPMVWTCRRTIGSAVRLLAKRLNRKEMTMDEGQELARDAKSCIASVAKCSDRISAYTSTAAEVVRKIGRTIRFYVMAPMYALFFVSLMLATIPIVVVRYLASG